MRAVPSIRDLDVGDGWRSLHHRACESPQTNAESAIVSMCDGVTDYLGSQDYNDEGMWLDYILGPPLGQVLSGIRGLLNGDIGRLDAGTVDSFLCDVADVIGWDMDAECFMGRGADL